MFLYTQLSMVQDFILIFCSFLLYAFAPNSYDLLWVFMCFLVFVIGTIGIIRQDMLKGRTLTFNMVFLVSFFLTTYAIGLFVLSTSSGYEAFSSVSMVVFQHVNFDYYSRACALSTIAISFYFFGYHSGIKNGNIYNSNEYNLLQIKSKNINTLVFVLFVSSIVNIFYSIRSGEFTTIAFNTRTFIYEWFEVFLCIALVLNSINKGNIGGSLRTFVSENKILILEGVILLLLFLYFGDRGPAIIIGMILFSAYVLLYRQISLKQLVIIGVLGVTILFAIRLTRNSDNSIRSSGLVGVVNTTSQYAKGHLFINAFGDLISASQELCVGYEIKDKYGCQKPEQIILLPFVPFPGMPTLISKQLWGIPYDEAIGSHLLNDYMSEYNSTFGKHCVSDLYMKWGVAGIVFFFPLFGFLIGNTEKKHRRSPLAMVALIMCMSLALYIPRSSIFDIIRPLAEIWFIMLFIPSYRGKVSGLTK